MPPLSSLLHLVLLVLLLLSPALSRRSPSPPHPPTRPALSTSVARPEQVPLTPAANVVACVVEGTLAACTSYASSFALGYVFTGVFKSSTLFTDRKLWHSGAVKSGKSFGSFGAAFAGSDVVVRRLQPGGPSKESKYYSSCMAGAVLARKEGGAAMCKSCAGYAGEFGC